jgi:hypothetical protein
MRCGGGRVDLLGRMIAARPQERAFGGLDRDSQSFLAGLPGWHTGFEPANPAAGYRIEIA